MGPRGAERLAFQSETISTKWPLFNHSHHPTLDACGTAGRKNEPRSLADSGSRVRPAGGKFVTLRVCTVLSLMYPSVVSVGGVRKSLQPAQLGLRRNQVLALRSGRHIRTRERLFS